MKVIFAKYNRERLPKYQTVTKIILDKNNNKYVLKEPLHKDAEEHIENIYKNYKLLKKYNINPIKPIKRWNGVLFNYIKGKSLEYLLLNAIEKNDYILIEKYFKIFLDFLDKMIAKRNAEFKPSRKFIEVFGYWKPFQKYDILSIGNIDPIFGNLYLYDGMLYQIDYEWVFEFEVPKDYVIWRTLSLFSRYHSIDIFNFFKFDLRNNDFSTLENNFYNFVMGKERLYSLPSKTLKQKKYININKNESFDDDFYIKSINSFSNISIAIFGLGKSGKMTYEFIKKYYPKKIKHFIDDNVKGEYEGVPIVTTDEFLEKYQDKVDAVVFGKYQHLNPKLLPNLKIAYLRLENIE